jgi:AraC-like DNA-binding protein
VLGTRNAILSGTSRQYFVPDFKGCLSLKSVLSGSAIWEAGGRRYVLRENSYLTLNDGQHYRMEIDSTQPVTTFCLFFERGFVESAFRTEVAPVDRLLAADPSGMPAPIGFFERIEAGETPVVRRLVRFAGRLARAGGGADAFAFDDEFFAVARLLVQEQLATQSLGEKLPAARAATRAELHRRVLRGRDFLLCELTRGVSLKEAAQAACLSPYHFHRTFVRAFGITPHRYLTQHRLARARHLLEHTSRSVTEICLECGFESPGSFSSLFHRHFGLSPQGFRRNLLSK